MVRPFHHSTLILANHNQHKARELGALLAPQDITIVTANDLDLPTVEENGTTFLENAVLKARAASSATHLPVLADDSGLMVQAFQGGPGVHSNRWAQEVGGYEQAYQSLEQMVRQTGDTSASFECALVLYWPDHHYETSIGRVEGSLLFPARGTAGFGYDPIFCPQGHTRTFAERDSEEKDAISHRGRAIAALLQKCFSRVEGSLENLKETL